MADIIIDILPGPVPICDFCSQPNPPWDYPCADHIIDQAQDAMLITDHVSVGTWASCDECAAFIDAGDLIALADHCLIRLEQLGPAWQMAILTNKEGVRRRILEMHLQFYKLRTGPRVLKEPK